MSASLCVGNKVICDREYLEERGITGRSRNCMMHFINYTCQKVFLVEDDEYAQGEVRNA